MSDIVPASRLQPHDFSNLIDSDANRTALVHLAMALGGRWVGPHPIVSFRNGKSILMPRGREVPMQIANLLEQHTNNIPSMALVTAANRLHGAALVWPGSVPPLPPMTPVIEPQPEMPKTIESQHPAKAKSGGPRSDRSVPDYDSTNIIERTWSDGTVDFACRECGRGGFTSVRSAGSHVGAHQKERNGTLRIPHPRMKKQPPIEETMPTEKGLDLMSLAVASATIIQVREIVAPGYGALKLEVLQLREENERLKQAKDGKGVLAALRDLIDKEITPS